MMEYKIENKVNSLVGHYKGNGMNNVLIYTESGQIIHVMRELDTALGWHKKIVSIGISDEESPDKITKATFSSKEKLTMLIRMLESYRNEMDY